MRKSVLLAGLASFVFAGAAASASATSVQAQRSETLPPSAVDPAVFADYLRRCHAVNICNGTYLVARGGVPLYAGSVGDAGDRGQTPLTLESRFDIGSISKQFTAAAVLRLVQEGPAFAG